MVLQRPSDDEIAWLDSKRSEFREIGTSETNFENCIEVIKGDFQAALDDCIGMKDVALELLIEVQYTAFCCSSQENCNIVKNQVNYLLKLRAEGIFLGFETSIQSINIITSYLIRSILNDYSQEITVFTD